MFVYAFNIDTSLTAKHKDDDAIRPFMRNSIILHALTRRKDILEKAAKTREYLEGISDFNAIIGKLEEAFGPCRLLIISEES